MAGRGRGRGRGFTFDIAQIGFQKGEALPAAIQQPPPLFPPLEFKPVPLSSTEADEYLLALKQEFHGIMQDSDYFIKPDIVKKDVQRYSDKYKEEKSDSTSKWEPDWKSNRFPAELKEKPKRKQQATKPNLPSAKKSNAAKLPDVTKRLSELEKNDEEEEDEDEEQNEREGEEEQEYDEEEQEEDNDYLVSHYDDGEEVGFQDDDDMDEGPTY